MTTIKQITARAILLGIVVFVVVGFGLVIAEQYQKHGAFGAIFFVSAIVAVCFLMNWALDWAGRNLK